MPEYHWVAVFCCSCITATLLVALLKHRKVSCSASLINIFLMKVECESKEQMELPAGNGELQD